MDSLPGYDAWKTRDPREDDPDFGREEAEEEAYEEAEAAYDRELEFQSLCRSVGDEAPWPPDFERCLWLARRNRGLEEDDRGC